MINITDSYGRDLDLNLLRIFAVVAEEGGITRAASRLYVTQPAISASMRRLASFIGGDLFSRQGRGMALTTRGAELLVATRAHLGPLVAATMAVPEFDPKASTATVRIALVDATEAVVLPRLLERMRERAPNMRLVVLQVQFRTVEALLLSHKVDLALCVADDLPRSIVRKPLGTGHLACLYDPRFCTLPKKVTARDYFAREHVAVSYAGDLRGIVEDARGQSRNVRVSVPSFSFVADVVDGSPLIGTVPNLFAEHIVKTRPHLRIAPLPFSLDAASLDLLWARTTTDDKTASFVRALVEEVVLPLDSKASRPRTIRKNAEH